MASLLHLYVFSFIVGGVFVGLSVFSGLDKAFDVDKDIDVDGDGDVDVDKDLDIDDVETVTGRRWRPWRSFKFWTFFLAFFGMTGTLFTTLSLWGSAVGVLALSVVLGLFAGLGVSYGLYVAGNSLGGKVASERDYVGIQAQVVLPVSGERYGKIKLRHKGRILELPARPDDDNVVFALNEECVVLDVEDGVARVAPASSIYGKDRA
jgi:hypothetical protein